MISGLVRLVVLRVFGARVLLALGILGWIRNRLRGRRAEDPQRFRADASGRSDRNGPRRVG